MNSKILIIIGILIIGFGIFSYATANDFTATADAEIQDIVDFIPTSDSSTVSIPLQDGTIEKVNMDISTESFLYIFTKMSENLLVTLNGKEITLPYKTVVSTTKQTITASAKGFETITNEIQTDFGTSKELKLNLIAIQEPEKSLSDTINDIIDTGASNELDTGISEEEQNQIDKDNFVPSTPTTPTEETTPTTPTEETTPTTPTTQTTPTRPSTYTLQNIRVRSKFVGTDLQSYVLKSGVVTITSSSNTLWDGEKQVKELKFDINSDGFIAPSSLMGTNRGFWAEPNSQIKIKVINYNMIAYESTETIPSIKSLFVPRIMPKYQRISLMGKLESTYSLDKIAKITINKFYLDQATDVAFNTASISRYATDSTANVYIKTESDSKYRFIGVYPADGSTRYFPTQKIKLQYTPTAYNFDVLVRYVRDNKADSDITSFRITPKIDGTYTYDTSFKEISYEASALLI